VKRTGTGKLQRMVREEGKLTKVVTMKPYTLVRIKFTTADGRKYKAVGCSCWDSATDEWSKEEGIRIASLRAARKIAKMLYADRIYFEDVMWVGISS